MKKTLSVNNQTFLRKFFSLFPVPCSLFPVLLALLTALCSLLTVLSCEQPFKAGLGPVIDLQDPVIVLDSPRAGKYIRNEWEFIGHASDDFKLDSVWFYLANYPYEELEGFRKLQDVNPRHPMNNMGIFYMIEPDTPRTDRNWTWRFKINTSALDEYGKRVFTDGHLKIRLMAIDHVTKYVVTDEILFVVKNDRPIITVDNPSIQEGIDKTVPGYLGSDHFNYNFIKEPPLTYKRYMEPKSELQGSISDREGIYVKKWLNNAVIAEDGDPIFDDDGKPILDDEGRIKVDANGDPKTPKLDENGQPVTVELFPPQIRFWEVYFNGVWPTDKNGYPVPDGSAYPAGEIPTLDQIPWKNLKDVGEIQYGVNSLSYFYKLGDTSGHYYAFQLRAQSTDAVQSPAYYPHDYYDDFQGASADFIQENSYVLLLVSESTEKPTLELYGLEDIWGKTGFIGRDKNGVAIYNDLPIPEPDKSDGNHPYIIEPEVNNRNGAFTLRMRAYHSGGIASAKVYWEKNDKSEKGRFIWDPPEPEGWPGLIPSKSDHYSKWGLNEPDGGTSVRSFVFTYTDLNPEGATDATATADRLPNTTEFQNNVMGGDIRRMSKIQRYDKDGPGGSLNKDGKPYDFDELPEDRANWQDVFYLKDGTYKFYVYATSNSGAQVYKPYEVNISIDRRKPDISLNYIEGSAKEEEITDPVTSKKVKLNTVNGVIQPWFIFSDSQPTDTGFRDGTSAYFRPNASIIYPEQAYILIKESDRDKMDDYFKIGTHLDEKKNIWPDFTGRVGGLPGAPVIPGVTVMKHGPVIDSACRFRTSPVYHIPPLPDPNPDTVDAALDDGNYRLYVFARDNAFNVKSESWPIIVDHKTDYPTFDFSVASIDTGVTEPDSAYDFGGAKYGSGNPELSFIVSDGKTPPQASNLPRNMFSASGIQVRIRDDDGLDLGVKDGAPSKIKVTFVGSRPVKNLATNKWEVEAYSDIPADGRLMTLGDQAVKTAFPPASDGGYVKDLRGNITYDMLLNLLKDPKYEYKVPAEATTIPDGLYRVGISICDNQDAKLKMEPPFAPAAEPKADAVTVNILNNVMKPTVIPAPEGMDDIRYFWIAVDNLYPVIDLVKESDGGYTGGIIPPGEKKALKGTVSDENGPITLVNWQVKGINGAQMNDTTFTGKAMIQDSAGNPLKKTSEWAGFYYDVGKGKWVYEFEYQLVMPNGAVGTYDYELTFQDRFGKQTSVSLRSEIDNDPPKVSLIRKIETFSRDFDDVELKDYIQLDKTPAGISNNRERLAVKVVNFQINATDNKKVEGVRWWLLPADTGSTASGFVNSPTGGQVLDYNAFPAKVLANIPGVYYGNAANPNGFNKGVYGVVDVDNRKFTIAFDSRKLPSPNGEYRLHIIAIDDAGNQSRASASPDSNLFQEVFFLQIEDAPYLDKGITPGEALANDQLAWPLENGQPKEMPVLGASGAIIRGTIWENNGFFGGADKNDFWPKGPYLSGSPSGSVTIWFSPTGGDLPSNWEAIVEANGGDITSPDGTKYIKKIIPNDSGNFAVPNPTGLDMKNKNISMTIELSSLFPTEFASITDGRKRYIIRATDSPVNKLKELVYTGSNPDLNYTTMDGNAFQMGIGKTSSEDENFGTPGDPDRIGAVREYRYRQYAFVYDAIPPKVVIDTPVKKPVQTYGRTFATEFILGGYISDANLDKTDAGDYYFDYYLNSDTKKTFPLKPMTNVTPSVNPNNPILVDTAGVPLSGQPAIPSPPADSAITAGQHIYAITKDPAGKVTVYFRIKTSDLANNTTGIIPATTFLNILSEGQHTLTLWAADKSGKEGFDAVDFIKDTEPPKITFTNLSTENKPYDSTNKSKVDRPVLETTGWWSKDRQARQNVLFGANALPLTTISYVKDSSVPELRGTISDLVSSINLGLNTDKTSATAGNTDDRVGTGDVNHSTSKFRYWIDNEYQISNGKPTTDGRYLALIDGAGTKNVRWTILLTSDGTTGGTPLYDGVHTIVLTAADTAGEEIALGDCYMIAFRIDSQDPRAAVPPPSGVSSNVVYGNVAYQNPNSTAMFTLTVAADDANLKEVKLRIKNTTTGKEEPEVVFDTTGSATGGLTGWTYYPAGPGSNPLNPNPLVPALPSPFPIPPPPATPVPPTVPLANDYILFNSTYDVPKSLFTASGKYNVIVAAWDHAKNKSEEFIFSFTYDMDKPKIEYTNPSDGNKIATGTNDTLKPQNFVYVADPPVAPNPVNLPGTTTPNPNYHPTDYANINRLISENLRIQGNVKDVFKVPKVPNPSTDADYEEVPSSPIRAVESRVEKWNWLTGAWVLVTETGQTADGWKALGDYSANTQTQVSWTKNLLGQNSGDLDLRSPAGGDLETAEGLYRIRIRAKDASIITIPPGTNDWNTTTGQGNPVVSDYQYFYFDRTDPTLEITSINGSTTAMDTYYSNPGKFTFKGTVTDNNRFAKVEVKFEVTGKEPIRLDATLTPLVAGDPGYTNAADNPARTINTGGKTQNWTAEIANAGTLPDGKYKVTVTVYDMTGRSTSQTKSFILDSTPPTLKFTLPAKVLNKGYGDDSENKKPTPWTATANGFASQIVAGGPTAVITGETGDKVGPGGETGSQSGIDQMWFHLGFIDGAAYNATNPFPSKDAIKAWESTLIERHSGLSATAVAALTVKQRNTWMDTIAEYRVTAADTASVNKGNAWFKLGGTLKPTGFIINNPNIYDWRFEIPDKMDASMMPTDTGNLADYTASGINATTQTEGLKLYTGTITVKGRQYTVGNAATRQMVRAIDGQPGGYYRLPLWVRLTDVAGNVEYYCHDIWIDANGSIPSTSIESPSNGTQYNARGGTISVDGVARSNTSVYDVIFRVFADNISDTNLDGIQTNGQPNNTYKTTGAPHDLTRRPAAANIVRITGYDPAEAGTVALLPSDSYYQTAWQKANLTMKGGSGEPVIPWSIMINSEDQIRNLIPTKGFASAGTTNDMIRVWLEVFVFNGEGSPVRSSIYPNDNLGTASHTYTGVNGGWLYGTADTAPPALDNLNRPGPRPYVRAFYIRTGSAAITHPNVGTWTADYKAPTPTPTPPPFARANFTWNGEDAGKQGGGGYGGAGTEMRSNKFAVSATLDPNPSGTSGSGLGDVAYRIKLDGGSYSAWTTVWKTGDTAITAAAPYNQNGVRISVRDTTGNRIRYYFDYAINSKSAAPPAESGTIFAPVNAGKWATTGGTVTVQIRMKDNSPQPNEAEQTIQVAVDNFPPLADTEYRTNPKVAGSSVNFMGRVYDYATAPAESAMNTEYTPRKLERVSVWFTKGTATGPYVNLNQKNTTAQTLTGMRTINVYQSRTAEITGGGVSDAVSGIELKAAGTVTNNFSYPGLGTQQPYNADYVRDITQATGQPQYKMLWSPVNAAVYDVRWQLTLDSTLLPDGDLVLHYIVVDAAGNASYYTQTGISVRNNYPEITRVTLYTNNNGQGAQYTMDATAEYSLNDYRSKMFADYKDSADKETKAKTTGYLNSGFISKNSYLGFKVETNGGNRPLNFRLQHVTRKKLVLDAAGLNTMLTARNTSPSADKINLYTIAWHGNYTPQKWRALGVPIDNNPNPTLGTHFVFNPVNIEDPTKAFNVADAVGTAEVWQYTAVVTKADVRNPTVPGQASDADPFAYGPTATLQPTDYTAAAGAFEFKTTDFGTSGANKINEYDGSHPTGVGDTKEDNPDKTAFFLIRVWDTVNTTNSPAETWVHDQLYDAVVVGLNVYLTDKNNPVARLYDLNPYTETAVIENNKNQTIKDAADPQAIGSNIVRGGLYNDGTAKAMVRSGFIDPRGNSTTLDPKNGVYFKDAETESPWQLINGLALPDYPNKVSTDTVPTTGNDKVSGKIILRGHAWDDQLIDEITLTLPNAPISRTILKLNASGKMAATTGYTDTAFVVEELHWKTGHSVEWAYVWDTGTAPATGQTIGVTVKDKNGGRTSASIPISAEGANAYHNTVTVDIVPYITGFERKTPDFTTKRSLQGWYSFYRGEQGVKVNGYNFGSGAMTVTTGGISLENIGNGTPADKQRTFDITGGASSGPILLSFGGTAAYNNYPLTATGITGKSWNREYSAYTPGSDLWINKPYAHIWRTAQAEGTGASGEAGAGTIFAVNNSSAGLDSPGMALQYTGTNAGLLHGSWTTYGRESLFYGQNINTKPTVTNESNPGGSGFSNITAGEGAYNPSPSRALLLLKAGEPYSDSDIDYYNAGDNNYTSNTSIVATYQRDGEPYLVLKPRLTSVVFNSTGTDGGGGDTGYFVSRIDSPVTTYRWKSTRIKKAAVSTANNNPGRVFISSYDSINKRLFFKTVAGTLNAGGATSLGGAPPSLDENNGGTAMYLDGGGSLTGSIGGIDAATQAGNWLALDYTSQGYPVVAYFDEQHQTLRLAYASNNNPNTGSAWTRRYVLANTSPLYLGSGSYVSMKIDRANGNRVHLAFYNSNNKAVVYATAPSPSGTFDASVIDRVVEGGQWTDISVDSSGNPWIVYADSSRTGNRDGARMAYKGAFTRTLTDPITGTAITGWEAMTMPSDYKVKDDRLNIAAWPPTGYSGSATSSPIGSWHAAVGYASDQYRIGYFFKPTVPDGF